MASLKTPLWVAKTKKKLYNNIQKRHHGMRFMRSKYMKMRLQPGPCTRTQWGGAYSAPQQPAGLIKSCRGPKSGYGPDYDDDDDDDDDDSETAAAAAADDDDDDDDDDSETAAAAAADDDDDDDSETAAAAAAAAAAADDDDDDDDAYLFDVEVAGVGALGDAVLDDDDEVV